MNPKFTPSKTVRDVIQFDKEHKQLRFLMDEEKVIPYREISSCSLKNQYYKKSSPICLQSMGSWQVKIRSFGFALK